MTELLIYLSLFPDEEFVVALEVATSGLDPFLAAKSWKLIGGAEALLGLQLECF